MVARGWWLGVAAGVLLAAVGCVKAPDNISVNVGGDNRPAPVDSSRVPQTPTLDDCRAELVKAYQNIQYLEGQNEKLKKKADDYKRERDDCRKRLKKHEAD
jgi:hypothetical protein